MAKIISYSLFGNDSKYTMGMVYNAYLAKEHFHGWEVWCYYSEDVPKEIVAECRRHGAKMIPAPNINSIGTFWRFLALDEAKIDDVVIFRDTDDRLNHVHRYIAEDFVMSDFEYHLIKGHRGHYNDPIMAGLWGAKKTQDSINMLETIKSFPHKTRRPDDQIFLRNIVFPKIPGKYLLHGIRDMNTSGHYEKIEDNCELGGVHEPWMLSSKIYDADEIRKYQR